MRRDVHLARLHSNIHLFLAGDYFAFAQGGQSVSLATSDTAILLSPVLQCQTTTGVPSTLSFWCGCCWRDQRVELCTSCRYWKTANLPKLEVCLVQPEATSEGSTDDGTGGGQGYFRRYYNRDDAYGGNGIGGAGIGAYGSSGGYGGNGGYNNNNGNNGYGNSIDTYNQVQEEFGGDIDDSRLQCVDEIVGVHAQQWILRRTTIPPRQEPFQVQWLAGRVQHLRNAARIRNSRRSCCEPPSSTCSISSASTRSSSTRSRAASSAAPPRRRTRTIVGYF